MNDFKIEWDLAKTELQLQVWNKLESLVDELDSASDDWEKYRPEERPEEMTEKELKKLTKSELIEQCLSMQTTMNVELDDIGTSIKETLESILEPCRDDLLDLRRKAEGILNRLTFVKLFG